MAILAINGGSARPLDLGPKKRPKLFLWLVSTAFFAATVLTVPASAARRPAQLSDTLVLEQRTETLGRVTTYVSEHGLKVLVRGSKCYLVAVAPSWKVMFCNDENKKALAMSYDQWLEHFPRFTYSAADEWDRCNTIVYKAEKLRRLGYIMRQCFFPAKNVNGHIERIDAPQRGEYYVIEKSWPGEQPYRILQKAFSCPNLAAIPVDLINETHADRVEAFGRHFGGVEHWLATSRIVDQKLPSSFFAYGQGYTFCRREAEVLNDSKKRADVDDVVRELLPK
ncbi:MAG: hypothetical protein KGS72_27545 [Cyanobacteria bacterium REEB67]|nr:hypothetical protein [Cyanobacteria bacterium REEB67]